VGATVLAALADAMEGKTLQVLQVINPNRPYTDTVSGCLKMREAIEAKARMTITGIIGNANFMEKTTEQDILAGYAFSENVAEAADLPLVFITTPEALLTRLDKKDIHCPVLTLRRQLVPPWRQADALGASGSNG
jgi:hypothetical protein